MEAPAHTTAAIAWRSEIRATLALAWPLILANLTSLDPGDRCPAHGPSRARPLAASALGLNLNFALNLFCSGLSPPPRR